MVVLRASRRIRGGNLSLVHSSTWVTALVAAVFLSLATGVAAQNTAGYTVEIKFEGSPCVDQTLTFTAYLYPDRSDKRVQRFVDQPDRTQATSGDIRFAHMLRMAGTYTTSVIITDGNGTKIG